VIPARSHIIRLLNYLDALLPSNPFSAAGFSRCGERNIARHAN